MGRAGGNASQLGDGSGGNVSHGEQQMKLSSLTRPPLTSRCEALFLTGLGLEGLVTPALERADLGLPRSGLLSCTLLLL